MMMNRVQVRNRVICFLTREQVDCLDQIGKDAMFSTGVKLPRTVILGCMAELIVRTQIRGHGIRNAEQFLDRVKDAIRT